MSTELLLDSSNPVITINQAILLFKINKQNLLSESNSSHHNSFIPISQSEIIITNITSNYVAYRARITRKKYYSVEPSHSVISPNSSLKVKITYYYSSKEKFPPEGHKFRFEGIVIPNNLKNKDIREIFDEYIINKKEVKGTSIKKVVEFIFDNNYNYIPSSDDIKEDLAQSMSNFDFSSNASNYSSAMGKSMERPSRISLRNAKKSDKLLGKKEIDILDPVKLKEQCDKLQNEYDNNVRELNDIKRKINDIANKNKYRYIVPDINFSSINTKTIAMLFGTAFFLVFYLTK
jgi:hypothetical protein